MELPNTSVNGIEELARYENWICWRSVERQESFTKVPINALTGELASVTDSSTWSSFANAISRAENDDTIDGVGFVFTSDLPYVGIDIDKCCDQEAETIDNFGTSIAKILDSYTEYSPSGHGLHIIAKGTLPSGRRRHGNLEMYSTGRYFTITGAVVAGPPESIEERTEQLAKIHREHFPQSPPNDEDHDTPHASIQKDIAAVISGSASPEIGVLEACLLHSWDCMACWHGDSLGRPRPDESPSAWDQSLANYLTVAGVESLTQAEILIMLRRWHSWPEKLRPDYYARTLHRALDVLKEMESADFLDGVEERPSSLSNNAPTTGPSSSNDAVPLQAAGHNYAQEPERVKQLEAISQAVNCRITDIIRYDGAETEWAIVSDIGTKTVSAEFFDSPSMFRRSMISLTSKHPTKMSRKQFENFTQKMLDAARLVKLGDEASEAGEIKSFVHEYLKGKHQVIAHEPNDDAIRIGTPFKDGDDLYMSLQDFSSWLYRSKGRRLHVKTIGGILHRVGCVQKTMSCTKEDGKPTSRSVWRLSEGMRP